MRCVAKFILLLIAAADIQDIECRLDGNQLRQLLYKLYSLSEQRQAVSRRNIADLSTIPGSRIFQEPSSRDLDVGFAVGVKDDDGDLLINNDSSKTSYSPTSVISQPDSYAAQEPITASKDLNIGVFVDPKNGVSYYAPGFVPTNNLNSKPNVYDTLPERYFGGPVVQPYSGVSPSLLSAPFDLNQQSSLVNPFNFSPYPTTSRIPNYLESISNRAPGSNGLPYPYEINSQQTIGVGAYPVFTPVQASSGNIPNRFSNLDQLQQTHYPDQGLYQQQIVDTFNGGVPNSPKRFDDISNQFTEPSYRQHPATANLLDSSTYAENYPIFNPRSYRRIPYSPSLRDLQHMFRLGDQVPKGTYRQLAQPVVRQEPQQPEVVVDQRGAPVMSAQPYGDRQVGAFRLRNDHGYQVMMNVPPVPTNEPTDGVLVMEMKATLYRPLN